MKPARSKLLRKTPGKSRSGSLREEPVEVYCRIKPIPPGTPSCIKVISPTVIQLSPPEAQSYRNGTVKEIQFTFNQVFDDSVTQKEVFDTVGLPLVSHLINGRNGLLFTYGVTGSGKTYTMNGEPNNGGIMPRCLDVIFNTIYNYQAKKYVFKPDKMNGFEIQDEADAALARQFDLPGYNQPRSAKTPKRNNNFNDDVLKTPFMDKFASRIKDETKIDSLDEDNMYAIFITYIEIYNNNVYDLLDDSLDGPISRKLQNKVVREDAMRNMYVHAVTEIEVKSPEEAFQLFYKGQKRKRMAHTNLNEESSRSHSIFTIRLVQAPTDVDGENILQSKKFMTISQLSLVDLAGSERTNRTKNTGQRLREAGNINTSLMALRNCLKILRENQKNGTNEMVPYRNSKLTHLFKNYFDGEGQVRMIVCVNPRIDDYDETVHVLDFAEMTQEVQVVRPNPSKIDIGLTPGRRKANIFKKAMEVTESETKIKELEPDVRLSTMREFPKHLLNFMDSEDEDTLLRLKNYLEQLADAKNIAFEDFETRQKNLRAMIIKDETEFLMIKQDNAGVKGILDQERKRLATLENELGYYQTDYNDLKKKIDERDDLIRQLQQTIDEKDMLISRYPLIKEKMKEKMKSKIREQAEKFRLNMPSNMPSCPQTPSSQINPQGTLYMPANVTPSQGLLSRRGIAVSNPRHRRSRSAGGGDVWLDHKPASALELNTVFQPSMKKRKSVTKLTDVKDIVNSKTSKYCLTTQEQDTDGELETKLYKGDVIPTTGGGAQVILNDVELLKQLSPTSEATSRKRSFVEGSNANTQSRCAISIEGHSKRSKS